MAVILVVDDEAPNRQLLEMVLAYDGHDVVLASEGESALELLLARRPDLAIVDLFMPGMSGTDLIGRIRRHADAISKVRIAIYSGTREDDMLRDFMDMMKIEHVIPKPAEPEEIIAAVRAALV